MGKLRDHGLQQPGHQIGIQHMGGTPYSALPGGIRNGLELFHRENGALSVHATAYGGLNAVTAHVDELVDGLHRVLRGLHSIASFRAVAHNVVQTVILGHKSSRGQAVGALGILDGLSVPEEFLRGMFLPVIAHAQIPNGGNAGLSPAPEGTVIVFNVSGDDVHMGVDDTGQYRRIAAHVDDLVCGVKQTDARNDTVLHQNVGVGAGKNIAVFQQGFHRAPPYLWTMCSWGSGPHLSGLLPSSGLKEEIRAGSSGG